MPTEFNTDQFFNAYANGIQNSYWNLARNRIILKYLQKYRLTNILDVGCGRGIVTSYLFNSGLNITGIDPGNVPRIEESELTIYYNINPLELPEALRVSVNTITLFDVIEHIKEPIPFIKGLTDKYPNLTHLVITIPARKELWTNFDDFYGHFRRYSLKDLKRETEDAGFELLYSRYFFHILYFLIYLNNKLKKQRKIGFNPPNGVLSIFLNRLMATLFYIETFLLPGKVIGSSIICVCKKKSK